MNREGSRRQPTSFKSLWPCIGLGRLQPIPVLLVLMLISLSMRAAASGGEPREQGRVQNAPASTSPMLSGFDLPSRWVARYWDGPDGKSLLRLSPKQIAELVPLQAGVRFCRCPDCGADETEDPLAWNIAQPATLRCRRCGVVVPSETYPAKVNKEVPEERVEVLPGVVHRYPFHGVDESKARYPDERLYLQAKRDYEVRRFLARAALYAAARAKQERTKGGDRGMATIACVIILRFAHVYPAYAMHYDQPGRPKYFQPARLSPPYRRGYQTGKWEWKGSLEVPMDLVIAYDLMKGDPAWAEVSRLLSDDKPGRTIERDLFRPAAEFSRLQPEEYSEDALNVYRGMLAVGRLLGDAKLVHESSTRIEGFSRAGFYHDGFWREADVQAHRRVLGLLDGWIGRMLDDEADPHRARGAILVRLTGDATGRATQTWPMLEMARLATAAVGSRDVDPGVQQSVWPVPGTPTVSRRAVMLGGAGLARLAIGEGRGALDVELRGLDSYSGPHFNRLAFRLSVGGIPVLDDLDEQAATSNGFKLATASHNTVIIDGLNQRETPLAAGQAVGGSDFRFFAADPDFQVVMADDQRAYPQSARRYRHTMIATASASSHYAVSVFEVSGGLQHDQLFHAAPRSDDRWQLAVPSEQPSDSLLPHSLIYLPTARPDDGRWFVQAYGEFQLISQARLSRPSTVRLARPREGSDLRGAPRASQDGEERAGSVRLHLLGEMPTTLYNAVTPDPTRAGDARGAGGGSVRASLVVRRRSADGSTLNSKFVTLFEPLGKGILPLRKVGRVSATDEAVVLYIETPDGPEHLIVNLRPGTTIHVQLLGGRFVTTDGLAVRVREESLVLAGGTFAEGSGLLVSLPQITGTVSATGQKQSGRSQGWFLSRDVNPGDADVTGRTLILEHGDGRCRSWTIDGFEKAADGLRILVREQPGFEIDLAGKEARYYQFPRDSAQGPHRFRVAMMRHSPVTRAASKK